MSRRSLIAAVALAAVAGAAGAQTPADAQSEPRPGSQCFRMSQIQNHTKADNQTLYLRIRNRDVYRLDMSGNCLAGASTNDALVMSPTSGNDLICRPIDLDLKVRMGPGALSPCIIKSMTKLTPDEIAALAPKVKP